MKSLINRSNVRAYVLQICKEQIPSAEVKRISSDVYQECDLLLRRKLLGAVNRHHGIGKTFKAESMV